MKNSIIKKLNHFEKKNEVRIIYAAESGSHLWGMASEDSDHNIRFIFHQKDYREYLKIDKPISVIEFKEDDLDFVGFDIYKFGDLLRNSNPNIREWLHSSIVYKSEETIVNQFKKIPQNRNTLSMHYYSIASDLYRRYFKGKEIPTYKRYLYVIRSILSIDYLKHEGSEPLLNLNELIQFFFNHNIRLKTEIEVLRIIKDFLSQKKNHQKESVRIQKDCNLIKLDHWIEYKLAKKPSITFFPEPSTDSTDIINAIVLEILK